MKPGVIYEMFLNQVYCRFYFLTIDDGYTNFSCSVLGSDVFDFGDYIFSQKGEHTAVDENGGG